MPASTTATHPALLTLSVPVLSIILESLRPADLIRTLTLTSKHPAFARFSDSQGPEEALLWTRLLRQCLAGFTPARAWLGLREGDFSFRKPMRDAYKEATTATERRLATALEAAGLTGTEWMWEPEGISKASERELFFIPTSVPAGKERGDFLAWVEAFTCGQCHKRGMASAQCAACGDLLCSGCTTGCEKEDGCPFALCPACDSANARTSLQVMLDSRPWGPGLIVHSCSVCPNIRGCRVHLFCGFIECSSCGDIRCPEHRCIAPGFGLCSCTREPLCARPGCRPAGHYFRFCGSCGFETCHRCEEKSGGRCRECGDELLWKDTDE